MPAAMIQCRIFGPSGLSIIDLQRPSSSCSTGQAHEVGNGWMGRGVCTKPNLTSRVWAKTWGPLLVLVLVLGLAVAVEQQKKHRLPLVNIWSCCSLLLASSM